MKIEGNVFSIEQKESGNDLSQTEEVETRGRDPLEKVATIVTNSHAQTLIRRSDEDGGAYAKA